MQLNSRELLIPLTSSRTVKALTIQQPHASMIASGVKTIEVRSRSTAHRGDLLIVAGKHRPADPAHHDLPRGVALAIVNVTDRRPMRPEDAQGIAF